MRGERSFGHPSAIGGAETLPREWLTGGLLIDKPTGHLPNHPFLTRVIAVPFGTLSCERDDVIFSSWYYGKAMLGAGQ